MCYYLIFDVLYDVSSWFEVLMFCLGLWQCELMVGVFKLSMVSVVDIDLDISDEYWFGVIGFFILFLLQYGVLDLVFVQIVKCELVFFDVLNFIVSQYFVILKDGMCVLYFQIVFKVLKFDGFNCILFYGYGGFEVLLQLMYSGSIGCVWLECGGVYVIVNICGGGEYGLVWYQVVLKVKCLCVYEDFVVVVQDLIYCGVIFLKYLGVEGGSNGGLLMGNMFMLYLQLFGVIVCEVLLLDMKCYSYLFVGVLWMVEYGNLDIVDWDFICIFLLYQNVCKDGYYLLVLFYIIISDDCVGFVQVCKMVVKMQVMDLLNVWFYENFEGGYGVGVDNKQVVYMYVLVYGFFWD